MNSTDETIYNLLNQLPQCLSSQSNNSKHHYRSVFASNVSHNLHKDKYAHRTMGLAVVPKPDPCHPLRRRQNYIELPEVTPLIRPHRMPPIPKLNKPNDKEKLKSSKNYVQDNITKIRCSLPISPQRYVVSDRKGNKFLIDGSGLQKDFIYKKNYGQIPSYLQAWKTSNEPMIGQSNDHSMLLMPTEERLFLIHNLKSRYADVFAEYQRLPLRLETTSTLMKHTHLTNELVNLERDIDLLGKHDQIFIVNHHSDMNKE